MSQPKGKIIWQYEYNADDEIMSLDERPDLPRPEDVVQYLLLMAGEGLTPRQAAFCLAFPFCIWNASKAAILAGYSPRNARQSAYQVTSGGARKAIYRTSNAWENFLYTRDLSIPEVRRLYGPAFHRAIATLREGRWPKEAIWRPRDCESS